jgi:hypothetical protein
MVVDSSVILRVGNLAGWKCLTNEFILIFASISTADPFCAVLVLQ